MNNIKSDVVLIGSSVNSEITSGSVSITYGDTQIEAKRVIIEPDTYISKDANVVIKF